MKQANNILLRVLGLGIKVTGIVMVVSIILQITGRYVPMLSFMWTEELARLTFIWFCFLGIAVTYHYKGHMGIDYFCARLNKKLQSYIAYFCSMLILVFSSVITYYGIQLSILAKVQKSPMMQLSFSWFYAAVPVGFGLIAVFTVFQIIENLLSSNKNKAEGLIEESV